MTDYDEVRYPGHAYAHTHPEHLYVIGRLHGLEPASPAACRVLEIGCGDGANLIPMAWQLPDSRFFGFDLAETSIAAGQRVIDDLGLKNLELRHLDLMEFPEEEGPFDYIIAHGFYSWVPDFVRERMLPLVRRLLAPQGIAFISYNAYPGGHLRNLLRDMVRFHIADAPDAKTKLGQARAFLGFLDEGIVDMDDHGKLLKAELARVLQFDPAHYFHDDLADINDSFHLHEFVARAGMHGLQYLTDADLTSTQDVRMPAAVREKLAQLSGNPVLRMQYLDFLRFRRFCQTLLCRDDVAVDREPGPAKLRDFYVGGIISPGKIPGEWTNPRGVRLRSGHPVAKAAFTAIGNRWPGRWGFDALAAEVAEKTGGPVDSVKEMLERILWEAYVVGMIDGWPYDAAFPPKPHEKPVASALAQYLLRHGHSVVTLLHGTVSIGDAAGRHLVSLLDGTRDQEMLVQEMENSEVLKAQEPDAAKRHTLARENVASGLQQLSYLALIAK